MDLLPILGPTLLTLIGGAIGWFLKSRYEAMQRQNEKLRDERASTYMAILEPFAKLFTDLSTKSQKQTLDHLKSFDYRKTAFRLSLVGDDEVVLAWNQMWKRLYDVEQGSAEQKMIIRDFGNVLYAIRRSIGSKKTRLQESDMLQWLIKDIKKLYE